MDWKILLRPIGLTVFVVSLVFAPFFPLATAAGFIFYAGSVYFAYQKKRDKILPAGTVDDVSKLPYRRQKLANLAIAAARDVERRLSTLPRDFTSRIPISAAEAGASAGAVVQYLKQEAEARKLANEGKQAELVRLADRAAENAEKTYEGIQKLQQALTAVALAGVDADHQSLAAQARTATAEILALKDGLEAARAELAAVPTRAALGEGGGKD